SASPSFLHSFPTRRSSDLSSDDQIYAAHGYVVLYINPRGSTSYGSEFAGLIDRDYPHHDYDDLMSGVDAVIERGYIDTDRLYVRSEEHTSELQSRFDLVCR